MKIAHVGNIASNAYLNAKRDRARGIEADCFDFGAGPAQWCPPWEDADWDWPSFLAPTDAPDWRQLTFTNGYQRQPWAKVAGWNGGPDWFDAPNDEFYAALEETREEERDKLYLRRDSYRAIAAAYDLTIFYGPEAGYGLMLPPGQKYVTFECSTMRSVPKRKDPSAHFLAESYQRAAQNIITNADCWTAAGELGVQDRSRFIPHPIDLEKFSPARKGEGTAFRDSIRSTLDCDLLFLAPARQQPNSQPDAKGNHKILAAFSRYVHESEKQGAPTAGLLLLKWGSNLAEMDSWLDALGIAHRVAWFQPTHKVRLPALYDAADIVLDQFAQTVGSYGTTTVEALAMGKPVITHINEERHAWCRDICPTPPHQEAATSDGIWEWLTTLAHAPGARENAGKAGAEWVKQWCSPERLGELYGRLYEDVLA